MEMAEEVKRVHQLEVSKLKETVSVSTLVSGLHTGFGARGGQIKLPKILGGGRCNMGAYRCTETGGGGGGGGGVLYSR